MKKIIIALISVVVFYGDIRPVQNVQTLHGGNEQHELAYNCNRARIKMMLSDYYDHNNIDPSEKDATGRTVDEIAQAVYEQTKCGYCAGMAEEFRKYAERYRQKKEQEEK